MVNFNEFAKCLFLFRLGEGKISGLINHWHRHVIRLVTNETFHIPSCKDWPSCELVRSDYFLGYTWWYAEERSRKAVCMISSGLSLKLHEQIDTAFGVCVVVSCFVFSWSRLSRSFV